MRQRSSAPNMTPDPRYLFAGGARFLQSALSPLMPSLGWLTAGCFESYLKLIELFFYFDAPNSSLSGHTDLILLTLAILAQKGSPNRFLAYVYRASDSVYKISLQVMTKNQSRPSAMETGQDLIALSLSGKLLTIICVQQRVCIYHPSRESTREPSR